MKSAGRKGQASDQPGGEAPGSGWIWAWAAVLATALWLSQLSAIWLGAMAAGSLGWGVAVARRPGRLRIASALLLWLAVGVAGGVQYRLWEVVHDWPGLQFRIEEESADALGAALDGLVEQGERAVEGAAEAADMFGGAPASPALFERLARLQTGGVSAIALFDADGSTLAWAGEHRGLVPTGATRGLQSYLFEEGPLFSYLYFIRPLPNGVTVAAAFLLDAAVEVGDGIIPFADRFERRHGTRPRFWIPERAEAGAVWDWATEEGRILSVSFAALTQQHWWERIVDHGRGGVSLLGLAAFLVLSAAWYGTAVRHSGVPVLVGTVGLLIAPLGRLLGAEALFSPLQFVLPGPLDVTLGVLLVLLLGGALWLLTRSEGEGRRLPPLAASLLLAAVFPIAVLLVHRSTAEGLLAARAAGGAWLQLATALLIAVPTFLILRNARPVRASGERALLARVLVIMVPALLAVGVLLWWAPGTSVPFAAAALWGLPAALLLLAADRGPGPSRLRIWLLAGWLAGTAALAFLWPLHVRAELSRAERELALLGTHTDPFLDFLLRQFADQAEILAGEGETGVNLLYRSWVASGLAREGYEARMTLWQDGEPGAELNLSEIERLPDPIFRAVAESGETVAVRHFGGVDGLHYLLTAPLPDGRTASLAVPPRRRIAGATPLARFLNPDQDVRSAVRGETLSLVPSPAAEPAGAGARPDTVHWVRTDRGWRSEVLVEMPEGPAHAHLLVATPVLPLLLTRAVLVVAFILSTHFVLWLVARLICRDFAAVPFLRPRWFRSFRGRLSVALFIFFLLPTIVFGAVSYGAVAREVIRSAAALAQQALDQAAASPSGTAVMEAARSTRTDLLVYQGGTLAGATSPELLELGLFHTWLPPAVHIRFATGEDLQELEERRLAESEYLVAYRRLDADRVLAAPIPLASHEITRRQEEFRDIALLVVLLGLWLSVVLALLVSRALASPLDELSRAAATVGGGNFRTRLPENRSDEFGSVYGSFNRMVERLHRTRAALVQETRRTETIVAEAATGVLALDAQGRVELINPRAVEILGFPLERGAPLPAGEGRDGLAAVIARLRRSRGPEAGTEVELDGRIVRLKLRRLAGGEGGGGAVVALEDVTAEVRTARVLAWGEMARQVAHEIKNPLTPIKLAVQHLRRASIDRRPDFDMILDRNVEAILTEIDRLGEISRAFSRFGTPSAPGAPLEPVDVAQAVREVLALYGGSESGGVYGARLPLSPVPRAVARGGELKEVLLNLLENAREAVAEGGEVTVALEHDAATAEVVLSVVDTGVGIPEDQLPRIFEPHFSTRSSGTGLGLAIVRRIVDSWGASIRVDSRPHAGTRFEIRIPASKVGG